MKKMSDKQSTESKSSDDFFIKINVDQKITKKELFSLISKSVASQKKLSQKELFKSLQAREQVKNTSFGNGIAFPHIILEENVIPNLIICKLAQKIDEWKCPDSTAVDTCFILLISRKSQKNSPRIKRLIKIFRKFADKNVITKISQCQTAEEIEKYL